MSLVRQYLLSDNGVILDALNEFPTIGACDFEVTWGADGKSRTVQLFAPAKGSVKYNYPLELAAGNFTALSAAVDGSQVGTSQRSLGQGSSGTNAEIGYSLFPSYLGGKVYPDGVVSWDAGLASWKLTSAAGTFDASQVFSGVYSLDQTLPIGTYVLSIIDAHNARVLFQAEPPSSTPSWTGSPIGVGGVTVDKVVSATQEQPVGMLQSISYGHLVREFQAQALPAPRVRADGPNGYFGVVQTGDVVPVSVSYGWLQLPQTLMRIARLTLYPETEELEVVLNTVDPVAVGRTGPTAIPPTDAKSIRQRIESIEGAVLRLQTNREPPATLLATAGDATELSKAQNGQVPTWNSATGKWVPA